MDRIELLKRVEYEAGRADDVPVEVARTKLERYFAAMRLADLIVRLETNQVAGEAYASALRANLSNASEQYVTIECRSGLVSLGPHPNTGRSIIAKVSTQHLYEGELRRAAPGQQAWFNHAYKGRITGGAAEFYTSRQDGRALLVARSYCAIVPQMLDIAGHDPERAAAAITGDLYDLQTSLDILQASSPGAEG
jgi:hypothetical protein